MPNYQGVWSLSTQFQAKGDGNWPANYVAPVGLFAGGRSTTGANSQLNTIQKLDLLSSGNTSDFGDLAVATQSIAASSSSTRAIYGGGSQLSTGITNTISYVEIPTSGNATDFGDLTQARYGLYGCSSDTRGIFAGGEN